MKRAIAWIVAAATVGGASLQAEEPFTISKEFTLMTSENLEGYLKPLFTTVEESINSNLYTTALHSESDWTVGINFAVQAFAIPDDQLRYDAVLPADFQDTTLSENVELRSDRERRNLPNTVSQPTIYGGVSTPAFSAPQPTDDFNYARTVTFMEGNNISSMPGIPVVQLALGIPTGTQLRFRFVGASFEVEDVDRSLSYFSIGLDQRFDHFFDLFNDDDTTASSIGLALNANYAAMELTGMYEFTTFAVGLHGSKTWAFQDGAETSDRDDDGIRSELTVFAGAQFEGMDGDFVAIREIDSQSADDVVNSPYSEIRNGEPIRIAIESHSSMRLTGGAAWRFGILELHASAFLASQPGASFGLGLWF